MSAWECVEQAIDLDLDSLSREEIEGGFRSLCGAMLLRAAQEMSVTPQLSKGAIEARRITRQWVFKDLGLITFSEACDACNVEQGWFRHNMVESAEAASVRRGDRSRAAGRWVFGRQIAEPATA